MLASTGTLTIQLDPIPAQQLAKILSRLIEEFRSDRDVTVLINIEDQLDDAMWIAQWLREYVKLELDLSQTGDLLEALVVGLDEETWSDTDVAAVTAVVDQLLAVSQDSLVRTDQPAENVPEANDPDTCEPERRLSTTEP